MELTTKTMFMLFTTTLTLTLILTASPTASAANVQVKAAYYLQDTIAVSSIDSTLFTHLFCAFATIDPSSFEVTLPTTSFSDFSSTVRSKNPSVKTLLSIGGGGGDSIRQAFASMASSASTRKTFIDSSIALARSSSFDGLDIDYEIPSSASDMSNLGALFSEWRAATETEAQSSGQPRLLLTAAVRYTSTNYPPTSDPYPAQSIAQNLDWINLMAYDFTAPASWGSLVTTGPTAALYDTATHVSGSDGVNAWVNAGVPANKLVLGIPFYGYAWKLTDASQHGYGAPADGPAVTSDGALTFSAVKDFVRNNAGAVTVFDSDKKGNYVYQGNTWISYDDVDAVTAKADYAAQNGLLGYFAWQIGGDDAGFTLSTAAAS